VPYDPFEKVSTASTDSWISNSYQEVPPMTDYIYHDAYDKTPANQDITPPPNMLTVPCDERPKFSDECEYASHKVTGHFHFKGHLGMLNCPTCEWCHNKMTVLYVLCDCEVLSELRLGDLEIHFMKPSDHNRPH
jgi:hypothetical protein